MDKYSPDRMLSRCIVSYSMLYVLSCIDSNKFRYPEANLLAACWARAITHQQMLWVMAMYGAGAANGARRLAS
jgi:hypothetical protein